MRLYFVRHGESHYNVLGLCNADPSNPVPLTSKGEAQAQQAALLLQHVAVDCIYVSELQRAVRTAQLINRHHGRPLKTDSRLNDRRSGFEGRPLQEYLAATQADPIDFRAQGGESYRDLMQRVSNFLVYLEQQPVECAIVVTHHEVLQIVIGRYQALTPIEMWRTPVDNGAILAFEIGS